MSTNLLPLGIIFSILSIFYLFALLAILYGLYRLEGKKGGATPFVSVIIAARNEARRISFCLQSLSELNYPESLYEVILVDDDSGDNTAEIIEKYCLANPHWQLIRITEKSEVLHGKKNALMQGIRKARGEIIFTTDADCAVPPDWLIKMVQYFKPDVSMVLGYSPLVRHPGFLHKILEFDNLFSVIVSAAPVKLGHPFNSVGRNLAYRKNAYESSGGFLALKEFRSGDDIHLTQRFRRLKNGRIDFCADPETFVRTYPPGSLSEIFHQQLRKNSKTVKLGWSSLAFLSLILCFHFLLILVPFFAGPLLSIWILSTGFKLVLEFVLLVKSARLFDQKHLIILIPFMQIFYPCYIIVFNILGMFQKYNWKK